MGCLYLDLASHQGLIACVSEMAVVQATPVDHRIDDGEFVQFIEAAIKEAGWTYKDLTRLACVTGPGGFTSLRVGVAAANTLAFALGIPSCGLHLRDVYAARGGSMSETLWLHSTKKTAVFCGELGSSSEPECLTLEQLPSALAGKKLWTGELLPEHRAIVEKGGLKEATLKSLEKTLPDFLQKQDYQRQNLVPWYGRGW